MDKKHLLLVEDDQNLAFVVADNLEQAGYTVQHCSDGESAWAWFQRQDFALCILDVMLPKMDGFALSGRMREAKPRQPLLFLTARSQKEDRIQGLKLGADDYITKPFSIEELVLRVQAILRRSVAEAVQPSARPGLLVWGDRFRFDYPNLRLDIGGHSQLLTQKEADLLRLFFEHPNALLRRDFILLRLWGEDDYFLGRSLDVFISRLRKFLAPLPDFQIKNIHGVGFRMEMPEAGSGKEGTGEEKGQ